MRNIVDNIEDPEKRKILLNFLDQSSVRTEYITVKETSSSCEDMTRLKRRLPTIPKRRRKSPASLIPETKFYRRHQDTNLHSEERKGYSLERPRILRTVAAHEQHFQNFHIRKNIDSEDIDSKNEDMCYTEESKEVPLEAILNKFNQYQRPLKMRSRRQSIHSAAKRLDDNHSENEVVIENLHFDLEAGINMNDCQKSKKAALIILPEDLIEREEANSGKMISIEIFKKWTNAIKSILILFLVLALVIITSRGIYLEIQQKVYNEKFLELNKEMNHLYKLNDEWKQKYEQ